ncbi:MAG TPA: hypothetical protein VGI74_07415 [Streptosporangiaceae bacterium]
MAAALVPGNGGATSVLASLGKYPAPPNNPTVRIAGKQHWCGTNGWECAEPALNWNEFAGYNKAIEAGARFSGYIGHDEPADLFYSNKAGSGNNATWQMVLPKDPPTPVKQNGSGGIDNFQLNPTFWLGMDMCDSQGSPNPDGTALTGHPTVPCTPDSDSNIFASTNPHSSHYIGLGPGQAFTEMQFYPPGWAAWPDGNSCTARQWCAALNIDTFSQNLNTGQFNNTACLNTVGPEPVNFEWITKNGKPTAPANPGDPNHFVPVPSQQLLMNSGDHITVHMHDTSSGLEIDIADHTSGAKGTMTASAANGFGNVVFNPSATKCKVTPFDFHPMYSTTSPMTRVSGAAHTYNISFSDETGHGEYCGKVGTDPNLTCKQPLGADTNDGDTAGPDPLGDDDSCLPASASLLVKVNMCIDIDGDFDGIPYLDSWPGSIANPTADALIHPTPVMFTSPLTGGKNYTSMAFESDITRDESSDTSFNVTTPCERHITNPADPIPGLGCVNPPPNSTFYPIYTTTSVNNACWWQFGGPFIPGTTNTFGGNAHAEYGPLEAVSYPVSPLGTISKRFNDLRKIINSNPCPA